MRTRCHSSGLAVLVRGAFFPYLLSNFLCHLLLDCFSISTIMTTNDCRLHQNLRLPSATAGSYVSGSVEPTALVTRQPSIHWNCSDITVRLYSCKAIYPKAIVCSSMFNAFRALSLTSSSVLNRVPALQEADLRAHPPPKETGLRVMKMSTLHPDGP